MGAGQVEQDATNQMEERAWCWQVWQAASTQARAKACSAKACSARHASWGRTDNAGRVSHHQASRIFLSTDSFGACRLSKMEQMKVRPCPLLVCWLLLTSLFSLFSGRENTGPRPPRQSQRRSPRRSPLRHPEAAAETKICLTGERCLKGLRTTTRFTALMFWCFLQAVEDGADQGTRAPLAPLGNTAQRL
eukprot:COSAG04_NODE_2312_length_4347_cov_4.368173_2_plen_191_part_00